MTLGMLPACQHVALYAVRHPHLSRLVPLHGVCVCVQLFDSFDEFLAASQLLEDFEVIKPFSHTLLLELVLKQTPSMKHLSQQQGDAAAAGQQQQQGELGQCSHSAKVNVINLIASCDGACSATVAAATAAMAPTTAAGTAVGLQGASGGGDDRGSSSTSTALVPTYPTEPNAARPAVESLSPVAAATAAAEAAATAASMTAAAATAPTEPAQPGGGSPPDEPAATEEEAELGTAATAPAAAINIAPPGGSCPPDQSAAATAIAAAQAAAAAAVTAAAAAQAAAAAAQAAATEAQAAAATAAAAAPFYPAQADNGSPPNPPVAAAAVAAEVTATHTAAPTGREVLLVAAMAAAVKHSLQAAQPLTLSSCMEGCFKACGLNVRFGGSPAKAAAFLQRWPQVFLLQPLVARGAWRPRGYRANGRAGNMVLSLQPGAVEWLLQTQHCSRLLAEYRDALVGACLRAEAADELQRTNGNGKAKQWRPRLQQRGVEKEKAANPTGPMPPALLSYVQVSGWVLLACGQSLLAGCKQPWGSLIRGPPLLPSRQHSCVQQ